MSNLLLILAAIFAAVYVGGLAFGKPTEGEPENTAGGEDTTSGGGGALDITAKAREMSLAIAKAEGFYNPDPNVIPRRQHNPGNLRDLTTGAIATYPDDAEGWRRLQYQVTLMLTNRSHVYTTAMSFYEVASFYVSGGRPAIGQDNPVGWAEIVAGELGMSPSQTLNDYLEA